MNQLTLVQTNGTFYVDSRQVSEMTGKRHDHLIRDIEGYKAILDETPNLGAQNFFIPSSYKVPGNNKTYTCYLLTRKGCDMVANKMTDRSHDEDVSSTYPLQTVIGMQNTTVINEDRLYDVISNHPVCDALKLR